MFTTRHISVLWHDVCWWVYCRFVICYLFLFILMLWSKLQKTWRV